MSSRGPIPMQCQFLQRCCRYFSPMCSFHKLFQKATATHLIGLSFVIGYPHATAQYSMDSLTHIAIGAIIGKACAGKSLGKKSMLLGAAFQSIPDIDFIGSFFLSPTENLL